MTRFWEIMLYVLLLGVLWGCHSDNKGSILTQAEECMETCPNSVIQILENLDSSSFDSDYQRAKFILLWTQARHKCHLPLGNDSLINVAVDYFTEHGERQYAAKALLYKGLVHKKRKEVEKATEAFAMSEQWFEGVEDDQYKALLYNHYGLLMYDQANYKNALVYLKKSYEFKLKGDSIHYVISACGIIANTYELMKEMDSAKIYLEKGMQYKDRIPSRRYYLYVKDYANFLRRNGEYAEAEQMLLECEQYIKDDYRYSLYSSMATLYYETKKYRKALAYAEKVVESEDSVVVRGGLLNLYRIHRQLGNVDESQRFHDLYREYDNDITLRRKTTEVAVIPHEVKVKTLQTANRRGIKIQWGLMACLVGVVVIGSILYALIRIRQRRQQQEWQERLAEGDREIDEMTVAQREMSKEIGLLYYQMERKKEQIGNMEQRQRERLQKEKDRVREKTGEIKQLKETGSVIMREKRTLEKDLEASRKEQRGLQMVAEMVEHDQRIDQRIIHYRLKTKVKDVATLLIQLKHGRLFVEREIPEEEIVPMLVALLEEEYPGMRQRIDDLTNNATKQVMCYLIALELDDEKMMARATNKKSDTIQRYHRECQLLVEPLMDEILTHGHQIEGGIKGER